MLVAATALLAVPSVAAAQEPPPEDGGGPADEEPATISGTLRYRTEQGSDEAQGVEVMVESADGTFTDSVRTGANGQFRFEVPAGEYSVSIDPDTLPDGVDLEDEARDTVQVTVNPGRIRAASFDLTSGAEREGRSLLERSLRLAVQGLRVGLILAMCSVGLSLIFGTTGLVNFSHGEMVTWGALMAYLFNVTIGMSMLVAAPLAIVVGGLSGAVFNRGVWRPLRDRGTGLVAMLVVSIGIGMLLRYVFLYQFGGANRDYTDFQNQSVVDLGALSLVPRDLWIIAVSIVILVGLALFLQLTLAGKAMRAVADNRDLAEASGINVERVVTWVWITGGALAATGGVFNALAEAINYQMGFQLLLLMFAAVTLGGLGTAFGALVGGIAIGMFIQLSTLFIDPVFKTSAALLVLVLVLVFRPQGILGQAERVG